MFSKLPIVPEDRVLLKRIQERIRWDKRLSPADVHVAIDHGYVTLWGSVDSEFRRKAADEVVWSTDGILSLDDRVVASGEFFRSDTEIKALIEEQLRLLTFLDGERITVAVVDGIVKLEGEVYRLRLKGFASGAVFELSGVKDCLNMIELVVPPTRRTRFAPAIVPLENLLREVEVDVAATMIPYASH